MSFPNNMSMRFRTPYLLVFAVTVLFLSAAKPTHQLKSVDAIPEGLPPTVASNLQEKGHALVGPKGTICQLWLAKNIELKPDFEPSLSVKYPFQSGQFIGALLVEKKQRYKDFRGQRVRAGLYTLRYGLQPEDGNHIGTSELADYILAIPVKYDGNPNRIAIKKKLYEHSAKTTRGTHPAIFSLMTVEKPSEQPTLEHDEERALWILNVNATGKAQDKNVNVPVRMVVIGKTEAE